MAATITTEIEGVMGVEHVILTVTDADTYTCKKIGTPIFCHMTHAEDMSVETNSPSYTISGRTITIYADGVSGKLLALSVYGKMA